MVGGMDFSRLLSVHRPIQCTSVFTYTHSLNTGWVCYWILQMLDSCLPYRMSSTATNCSFILLLCPCFCMNNCISWPVVTHENCSFMSQFCRSLTEKIIYVQKHYRIPLLLLSCLIEVFTWGRNILNETYNCHPELRFSYQVIF